MQNMTSGNITRQIFFFSLPIVLGNITQQLYNTADAMVVGRLIGNDAFASVSVANPIMSVVLFFLVGMTLGINALLARQYGAGDEKQFRTEYCTAFLAGVGFTVLASGVCVLCSRQLLLLVHTPAEILDATDQYLKIIFVGMIFAFLYNFFANVLRAVGDSRAAFLFLVASSCINVVLDIVLVSGTSLGVRGAAIATVISQLLSSLFCILYIYRRYPLLNLHPGNLVFEFSALRQVLSYSWASAFQQTVLYLGRLLVQGAINAEGIDMITGYNAAFRLESFELAFIEGNASGLATFSGQNLGAKRYDRLRSGLWHTIAMNYLYLAIVLVVLFAFPEQLIGLYVTADNPGARAIGVTYITHMLVGYLCTVINSSTQGFFRGVGRNRLTMVSTTLQIIIRCSLTILLVPRIGILGVCIGCTMGWVVMTIHNSIRMAFHLRRLPKTARADG